MEALQQALRQVLQDPIEMENEADFLRAAVMVPIVKTEDGWSLLFEVRAASLA